MKNRLKNKKAHGGKAQGWWHKYVPLLFVLIFAGLGTYLLLGSFAATPPVTNGANLDPISTYPDTTNGIHVGTGSQSWIYAPKYAKGLVDDFEGNGGAPPASVKAQFPSTHTSVYISSLFDATQSLAWYQANHPDWVLYQCDGKTPAYYEDDGADYGYDIPLDFSNPAVMAYKAGIITSRLTSGTANGAFFDNMFFENSFNACGVYRDGKWTLLNWGTSSTYSQNYINARVAYLSYMRTALNNAFPGKAMSITINSYPGNNGITTVPNAAQYLQYIDADFDEPGFISKTGARVGDSHWQEEISGLQLLASAGKAAIINNYAPPNPVGSPAQHDVASWILANYLLVKGSHTYVYIAGPPWAPGCPTTGCFVDFPEYHVPIGSATSAMFQSQGVYMRQFSGGLAVVNPSSTQSFTVNPGKTYLDMYGNKVGSFKLGPTDGVVLLNVPAPPAAAAGAQSSTSSSHPTASAGKSAAASKSANQNGTTSNNQAAAASSAKKSSSNPITKIKDDLKNPVDLRVISGLTFILLSALVAVYWYFYIHRLSIHPYNHPYAVGKEWARPPEPKAELPQQPMITHAHGIDVPQPGTTIKPKDK